MTASLSDLDLLSRLVAFDSVSRNSTRPIADFIADYLDRPGVRVERNPASGEDKANLVVSVGPESDERREGLVLSGHMDVVPADEADWRSDPFTLTARDGTYVGRGSADMKGFLALAVNRAATLDPAALRRPLVLLFTYDEELGTLGARHFVETFPHPQRLPRDVIIGEPTSLVVVRMHKGYLKARLAFTGVAAHSGYPHLGKSAIEPAGRGITALAALGAELAAERPAHHEHFPDVPYAPLNIGRVAGGVAINIVPDRCVVEFGIRLLPDMDESAVLARVRAALDGALGDTTYTLDVIGTSPPMLLPEDAPLHRRLCKAVGQQATHSVSFATDAGWLQTVGFQCVIFGPGAIEVAHKPNEFVPAGQLERAGAVLDRVIHDACVA